MEFQDLRLAVLKTGVLSFDLETTSLDTKTAEIVLIAMASGKGNGIKRVAVTPTPEAIKFLVEHLENPKMRVVGHNVISYDLEVLHYRGIIKMGDVKAKIIDTLLLSWLYNENMPHGLKPCVKRFFNYDMTTYAEAFLSSPSLLQIDESRKQIEEIQKKEIDRVGTVFRKQRSAAKKKLELDFKEKYTGRRTKEDNEEKKVDRTKIAHHLEKEYGPDAIDTEKARLHLSKIVPIFDTIAKLEISAEQEQREYAKDDAKQTLRLYYFLRRHILKMGLADWADMMGKVRRIAAVMEMNGIRIDVDTLKEYEAEFSVLVQEFQARAWDTARGEFNLSSPKQIKELIYQKMAIEPVPGDVYPNMHEKAGEWKYSTDEATLSRMPHKIGQQILDYRAIQKLHSTYIKTLYEKASSNPERRLYGRFNTTGTVTGRWSSSGPNLQNIPSRSKAAHFDDRIKDLGPKIRRLFVASPGKKLICSDLSQIELRLITHLTQDLNLMSVYTESAEWDGITYYTGDIHHKTATMLDIMRKLAKNLNFGLCYGMFPKKFARYARLFIEDEEGNKVYDVEKAAKYRNGFFMLYPGILDMMETLEDMREMKDGKFPQVKFQTICGRYRHFPIEDRVTGGKILNSIIQGSASDILNVIVWAIDKFILQNPRYKDVKMILQVHDEVCLEAPEELADEVGILVKYIMECDWFPMSIPVLASAKICDKWSDNGNDDIPEVGVLPPESSGIKPAVAMLTSEDRKWASQFVTVKDFTPDTDEVRFVAV